MFERRIRKKNTTVRSENKSLKCPVKTGTDQWSK